MTTFTGPQFEDLCLYRMNGESVRDRGYMDRVGVTGASLIGRSDLLKDFVDFQGEALGVAFKMEAKVTSSSHFKLHEVFFKRGQYEELKAFEGVAFVLIHFNARSLLRKPTPARTIAFPVWDGHEFWKQYEDGTARSITHVDCERYGSVVEWSVLPRHGGAMRDCTKLSPDIVAAVQAVDGMRKAVAV
jgi:hypothetical protein